MRNIHQLNLYLDGLQKLIRETGTVPAGRGDTGAGEGRNGAASCVSPETFNNRVLEAVQGTSVAVIGGIGAGFLGEVGKEFGAQWEDVLSKASAVAADIAQQYLEPGEFISTISDMNFAISFKDSDLKTARVRAALIADGIKRKLLATDEWLSRAELRAGALEIDASDESTPQSIQRRINDFLTEELSPLKSTDATGRPGEPLYQPEEIQTRLLFAYRPLWDVQRNVVSTYLLTPLWVDEVGSLSRGYQALPDSEDPDYIVPLDLISAKSAIKHQSALRRKGRKLLTALPVHYESLRTRQRKEDYFDVLRGLSAKLKQRFVFEIVGIPVGMPAVGLEELAGPLKSFGRAVMAQVPLSRVDLQPFKIAGFHAVVLNLDECDLSEAALFPIIEKFAGDAEREKIRTAIHGVPSISLAMAALTSGINYVDGEALHYLTEAPKAAYRYYFQDFYAELFRKYGHGPGSDRGINA